jgi:DNA-binding response OmpR family regulator
MADPRILLLEDEKSIADLLVLGLESAGYRIDHAANVTEANQLLAGRTYSLVVADWRLPDGDGITVADLAAKLGAKTAILTAYSLHLKPSSAARHEIWTKPMRPSEFLAAVQRRIGKADQSAN